MCNICFNVTQFVWQLTMILESYIFRFRLCCADGSSYHMNATKYKLGKRKDKYTLQCFDKGVRARKRSKTIKETHTHTHTQRRKSKLEMEFQQLIIMIIMRSVHCVIMIIKKEIKAMNGFRREVGRSTE